MSQAIGALEAQSPRPQGSGIKHLLFLLFLLCESAVETTSEGADDGSGEPARITASSSEVVSQMRNCEDRAEVLGS